MGKVSQDPLFILCIFTVANGSDAAACESKEKVLPSLLGESYSKSERGVGRGVSDVARAFRAWGSKAMPQSNIHSMVRACS